VNYGFGATDITQVAGWSLRTGFGAIGEAASPNVDRYLSLQWKQYIDKLFISFKKRARRL
jgi:hypothetical protein